MLLCIYNLAFNLYIFYQYMCSLRIKPMIFAKTMFNQMSIKNILTQYSNSTQTDKLDINGLSTCRLLALAQPGGIRGMRHFEGILLDKN